MQYNIHSMQYTVQRIQHAVCSTTYTVCSIQYNVYSTQYAVQRIQYAVCSTTYTVRSMQYNVRSIQKHNVLQTVGNNTGQPRNTSLELYTIRRTPSFGMSHGTNFDVSEAPTASLFDCQSSDLSSGQYVPTKRLQISNKYTESQL